MATKAQLKQRCKELEDMLAAADNRIQYLDKMREEGIAKLARTKESEDQYWHNFLNEQRRAQFYWTCMSKVRHILALDTIEQLTHRERNDKLRQLIGTLALWMDTTDYSKEFPDDIPF